MGSIGQLEGAHDNRSTLMEHAHAPSFRKPPPSFPFQMSAGFKDAMRCESVDTADSV